MPSKKFLAGAATSNITPPLGVSLNGGMRDRAASHIHDELHARCLVLDDGDVRIALVICDSCMLPGGVIAQAKHLAHGHTSLPMDRMLIAATHTHSAPTATGVFQSEPEVEYLEFLMPRISDGIRRAINNLAPAKVGWGVGKVPQHVHNRRWRMKPGTIPTDPFGGKTDRVKMNPPRAHANLIAPAGPIDPDVSVLAVQHADGRPLAMLANYSLHYVGGSGPGHVSADYFGMFSASLGRLLKAGGGSDPPFVGMMSNGTSGNINNINFRAASVRRQRYEQMRRVAHDVASEAARVHGQIKFSDWVSLDMRESRVKLGRRLPTKADVAKAKFILSQGEGVVLRSIEEIYANETMRMRAWSPVKETLVQAIRIGELGIAASPCETFVETGLAIKAASPLRPTFTIELANDYAGYLPTPEHHQLGGYETWRARSSYLDAKAEPKIRKEALKLLEQVAKSG